LFAASYEGTQGERWLAYDIDRLTILAHAGLNLRFTLVGGEAESPFQQAAVHQIVKPEHGATINLLHPIRERVGCVVGINVSIGRCCISLQPARMDSEDPYPKLTEFLIQAGA
jgi:hypothetical protein